MADIHTKTRPSKRQDREGKYPEGSCGGSLIRDAEEALSVASRMLGELPDADNAHGALAKMLHVNALFRNLPWPSPFDRT